MKQRAWFVGLILVALAPLAHAQNYKFIKSIPIEGDGSWDYLSIDAQTRRLYVTHENEIVVIGLTQDKAVGTIADTPGVHGFATAPEIGRGFSSNGTESSISVIDLRNLKTIAKVEAGENPDAILYEPGRSEVYSFNGRGKSITVFNAKSNNVVTTVPLSGKPEFAAIDAKSGRIFCNIEDKNEVAVLDAKTHTVIATWPLAPGIEPTGMAFDAANHRLFVGCHNKLMEMLDSDTGKIVAAVPTGSGVNACAFDDATHLAFASCGNGTVTIAKEETPDKLTVVQTLVTEHGAHTMALDPVTHRIYTCTAQVAPGTGPSPSLGEHSRPNYVPGTFHVLVYGTE